MRVFLYKFWIFSVIFISGLLSFSWFWDPFRVFRYSEEFYQNNLINSNREFICLELFKRRNRDSNSVENLIIGNSRSQAFKTEVWSNFICVDYKKSFHYDGSSFGLYRTKNALQYLTENCDTIKNLLLVMDVEFFSEVSNPKQYMYAQPPEVSRENGLLFYYQFLKSGTHPIFILNYLIRRISGKHFGFMKYYLVPGKDNHTSNNITADLHYFNDIEIKKDSVGYYNKKIKSGVFYKRNAQTNISEALIGLKQIELLNQIKKITFKKVGKVKIIISPLYNQVKLNPNDLTKLQVIFGVDNVSDFSGINRFTQDFRNYYESSHFKPTVAKEILKEIYKD
jgi:hypothetical protein